MFYRYYKSKNLGKVFYAFCVIIYMYLSMQESFNIRTRIQRVICSQITGLNVLMIFDIQN